MDPLLVCSIAILGLAFGSFSTVLTYRLPQGQTLSMPLSYCPECKSSIRNFDKIPLLSYILLQGRCRSCKNRINSRYVIIEVTTMALFIIALFQTSSIVGAIALFCLAILTMPLIYIDLQYKRLPNVLTYSGISIGFLNVFAACVSQNDFSPLLHATKSFLLPSLFFYSLHLISRGGMGMGDVKLAGMVGILLFQMPQSTLILGLFLAFLLGAITGLVLMSLGRATRKTSIPFGPFILIGIWIAIAMSAQFEEWFDLFFQI